MAPSFLPVVPCHQYGRGIQVDVSGSSYAMVVERLETPTRHPRRSMGLVLELEQLCVSRLFLDLGETNPVDQLHRGSAKVQGSRQPQVTLPDTYYLVVWREAMES